MKRLFSIMIILLLIPTVFAQEAEVRAGILPDSPIWGIDNALDRLSMLVSPANGIRVAEERLQEIKAMSEKNVSDQIKVDSVNKAEKERTNALEKGLEIGFTTGVVSSTDAETIAAHHIEVLNLVRNKVPEEARKGIDNAIIKSQEHLEKAKQRQVVGSSMASRLVWAQ